MRPSCCATRTRTSNHSNVQAFSGLSSNPIYSFPRTHGWATLKLLAIFIIITILIYYCSIHWPHVSFRCLPPPPPPISFLSRCLSVCPSTHPTSRQVSACKLTPQPSRVQIVRWLIRASHPAPLNSLLITTKHRARTGLLLPWTSDKTLAPTNERDGAQYGPQVHFCFGFCFGLTAGATLFSVAASPCTA